MPLSRGDPGDRVLVRTGDRVSVDGIVVAGSSEIDHSLVTGDLTPLIAALAMSGSSLIVTLNALRLGASRRPQRSRPT